MPEGGLEPPAPAYETGALPVELLRRGRGRAPCSVTKAREMFVSRWLAISLTIGDRGSGRGRAYFTSPHSARAKTDGAVRINPNRPLLAFGEIVPRRAPRFFAL